MDKKTITIAVVVIALSVALGSVLGGIWNREAPAPLSGAGSGFEAFPKEHTMVQLAANTVTTLISTTSDRCSSRVITVNSIAGGATGIMMTFGEHASSSIPSTSLGHWQLASSTVAYDGEIFGCGKVKAIAGGASKVTITEF